MAVIHVLSVGISLINNVSNTQTRKELKISPGSARLFSLPQENANADEKSEWIGQVLDGSAKDTVKMIDTKNVLTWSWAASAELTAIRAAIATTTIHENDTVVLLASDTPDGLTAAFYNAYILASGDLGRIEYRPEAGDDVRELQGKIIIYRMVDLDGQENHKFVDAMRGLGSIGRGILALTRSNRSTVEFHLSGGYRSLLPFLLSLAEALCGLCGSREVTAFTVTKTNELPIGIKLPLRVLPRELMEHEVLLSKFDDNGYYADPENTPKKRLLQGVVYDSDLKLTAFGHGLRELYKDLPNPEA